MGMEQRVTLEEKKSEILNAFKVELLRLGIPVQEEDIHSTLAGNKWSIWIQRKDGSTTARDKFLVNLEELSEGVNYMVTIGYRARRWSEFLKAKPTEAPAEAVGTGRLRAPILIAEDDADDRSFINKALKANLVKNPLVNVANGEELLDYLRGRGQYAGSKDTARPCLILLDLNMPRVDGREALKTIKSDPGLRKIPVVILTTSLAEEDILNGYENGVNSYITKPASADGFVKSIEKLQDYWLHLVQLPTERNAWA